MLFFDPSKTVLPTYPLKLAQCCFSVRMKTAKAWLIDSFALSIVQLEVSENDITGIIGLWQPNVHSDVAC